MKVIPDNQTRILALEKGEIDLIWGKNMIDADALNKYRDSKKFSIAVSSPTSTRQIVLNTTNDILKDKKIRTAIQHATNKSVISQGVFHGFEPGADTLYSTSIPYCDIDLKPYKYDMKEAAKLIEEAGYKRDGKRALPSKTGSPWRWGCFTTPIRFLKRRLLNTSRANSASSACRSQSAAKKNSPIATT